VPVLGNNKTAVAGSRHDGLFSGPEGGREGGKGFMQTDTSERVLAEGLEGVRCVWRGWHGRRLPKAGRAETVCKAKNSADEGAAAALRQGGGGSHVLVHAMAKG